MANSGWTDPRPMSPHLQIWRWHVTMATFIFQRASGVGNAVGAVILVSWLLAVAGGEASYNAFAGLLFSPLGKLVLFGLAVSCSFHLFGGIRYLLWDSGKGFEPEVAKRNSWIIIGLGVVGGLLVFILGHVA